MPTYEYRCTNCGHTLEEFQPMSAEPLKVCPKCGKETLKRAMGGGGGMIFKGGGFYQTDYKNSGRSGKTEKKKEAKPESKTEPGKEKTTETKKSGDASTSQTPGEKK